MSAVDPSGEEQRARPPSAAPPLQHTISMLLLAIAIFLGLSMLGAVNYAAFLSPGIIVSQMIQPLGDIDFARRNIINAATLNGFYLFLSIFALLFALLFGFYYKFLLRGTQNSKAAAGITVSLVAVLGTSFALASPLVAPYMDVVRAFENTFGYAVLQLTHNAKLRTVLDIMYTSDAYAHMEPVPGMAISYNFMATLFNIFEFRKTLSRIGREGQSAFDFHACGDREICAKVFGSTSASGGSGALAREGYNADLAARRSTYDPVVIAMLKAARGTMDDPPGGTDAPAEFWSRSSTMQDLLARELAKMVLLKHMVGHLCWVYLSSVVASLVAIKYLAENR